MINYTYLHPNSGYPVNCRVSDLPTLLDYREAVLLPIQSGSKRPSISEWQKLKFEETQTSEHQAMLLAAFNNAAVGVQLGNGIYAIDVDNDELAGQFLAVNPRLQNTLRTRGARGCQFWLKIDGKHPESSKIKLNGQDIGEWRSKGNQSVVYGQHPSGPRYQILTQAKPVTIKFEDIEWPEDWKAKFNEPEKPKEEPEAKAESRKNDGEFDYGLGKRIAAYIEAIPGAIEGEGGHSQTLSVASALTHGFELSAAEQCRTWRCTISDAFRHGPPRNWSTKSTSLSRSRPLSTLAGIYWGCL
jgi:Bifunctional DNA primase/polymerase, N-terminal